MSVSNSSDATQHIQIKEDSHYAYVAWKLKKY